MDRDKENKQNLPEAPASVTARIISNQGSHLLFTLRDTTVSGLLEKFAQFEKHVLELGWKPETFAKDKGSEKGEQFELGGFQAVAHGTSAPKSVKVSPAICAACGEPATKKSGLRKDGSRWEGVFCSTGDESHKVWLQ